MKKILTMLALLLLSCGWLLPVQAKITDEHYFRFTFNNQAEVKAIKNTISIDKVKDNEAWAYANTKEFEAFKKRGFQFEELMHPTDEAIASKRALTMAKTVAQMANWDRYPTYNVYVQMMNKLANDYPSICKLENFGTTTNNRQLLALKISDNVQTDEDEAEVFYSNTMHGDETTGYIMLLRLADYLAANYNSNARVTNLVSNLEIFIAPNTNPDGTYKGGNDTLASTRTNGNNVDLNRNYPDFISGDHPDGELWQPETIANMNFTKAHHFVMGFNGHGGTEVLNYPWDTKPQLNADDTWWQQISQAYVDTCRKVYPNYMTHVTSSGITNGYAWYEADGSHQDWMNYYSHCREVTMEFSYVKLLGTESLNTYYGYNKNALLSYMEWCFNKGIKGRVTDGSGNPIHKVQVKLLNHDQDSTEVYTEQHGVYYRLINPGTYNMQFTYNGMSKIVNNVVVPASGLVTVDVTMQSIADVPAFGALTGNTASPGSALNLNLTVTTDAQVPEYVKATYITINGQPTTINMTAAKADRHYTCTIPSMIEAAEGTVYFKSKYPGKTEVQSSNYPLRWSVDPVIYFTEDFEGSFPPANWTNNEWVQGTEAHGGSKCAKALYTAPTEKILTTRVIDLSGSVNDTVSFWWKDDDIDKVVGHDTTYFQISDNGGQNWTTASFLSAADNQSQYNKFTYVLPANMLTNNFKMRWKDHTDKTGSAWGVGVDDIKIVGFPIAAIIENGNVVISHNTVTNYPNPFNPETVINFNLQSDALINLSVFNIKGELVSTLINSNQTAGIHAVKFDGSKLNSGVYFYRLSAGKENVTGKMMLVK